jgi:hypothetical protein
MNVLRKVLVGSVLLVVSILSGFAEAGTPPATGGAAVNSSKEKQLPGSRVLVTPPEGFTEDVRRGGFVKPEVGALLFAIGSREPAERELDEQQVVIGGEAFRFWEWPVQSPAEPKGQWYMVIAGVRESAAPGLAEPLKAALRSARVDPALPLPVMPRCFALKRLPGLKEVPVSEQPTELLRARGCYFRSYTPDGKSAFVGEKAVGQVLLNVNFVPMCLMTRSLERLDEQSLQQYAKDSLGIEDPKDVRLISVDGLKGYEAFGPPTPGPSPLVFIYSAVLYDGAGCYAIMGAVAEGYDRKKALKSFEAATRGFQRLRK